MMEAWLKVVLCGQLKGLNTNISTQRWGNNKDLVNYLELEEKAFYQVYSQEPVIRNKSRTGIKSEFDQQNYQLRQLRNPPVERRLFQRGILISA